MDQKPSDTETSPWNYREHFPIPAPEVTSEEPDDFHFRRARLAVTMRMFQGHFSVVDQRGDELGTWPAVDVSLTALGGPRFLLEVDEEQFVFYAEQPEGLLADLETETERFVAGTAGSDTRRKAAIYQGYLAELESEVAESHPHDRATSEAEVVEVDVSRHNHLMVDVVTGESHEGESYQAKFADSQREVVRWLEQGMLSWFGFYLRLHDGGYRERLSTAGEGLDTASKQLRGIGADLEYLSESGHARDGLLILHYRDAVLEWADALELIGLGARTDQSRAAADGFDLLNKGTAIAAGLVDLKARSARRGNHISKASLKSLRRLRPSVKARRTAVKRAKEPWKNAMLVAGADLQWRS